MVTGGSGFIGSALVRKLVCEGHDVRVLSRSSTTLERLTDLKIKVHRGDLTVAESLKGVAKGVEVVYHLAGVLGETCRDEGYYKRLHVEGTENLLRECANHGIKKFIHCSTTGVLGPMDDGIGDESDVYNPSNVYESTKAEGEKLVLKFGQEQSFPVTVLRPGMVYGPGDMHHLGLYWTIKKGYFFLINSGKSYLDPVFVEDVVCALMTAAEKPHTSGEIYIIVGPRPVTVCELAQTIAGALGRSASFPNIPKGIAMALARILSYTSRLIHFEPPLTASRVKLLTESRVCSIEKAREQLSYEPIGLKEGITQTVSWYKENGYL